MKKKNIVIMPLAEQHKDSQNRLLRQTDKLDFLSALSRVQYIRKT